MKFRLPHGKKIERLPRILSGCAAGCALILSVTPLLKSWEERTYDLRFALRGPRQTKAKIVLATVGPSTLDAWQTPMALWGDHLAAAMRAARRAGAERVGLDIYIGFDSDAYLRRVALGILSAAGWTQNRMFLHEEDIIATAGLSPNQDFIDYLKSDRAHNVLSENAEQPWPPGFALSETPMGSIGLDPDRQESEVRTLPITLDGWPSFAALLAAPDPTAYRTPGSAPPAVIWINYIDTRPGKSFTTIELNRLVEGNLSDGEREALRGAIVLIGGTYPGAHDFHLVGAGRAFTGTEIVGQAVASILDGRDLKPETSFQNAAFTLIAVLAGLGIARLSFRFGFTALVGCLAALFASCTIRFTNNDELLPMMSPMIGLALPFLGMHIGNAITQRRLSQHVEQVFGQYLSPGVRDYLLAAPENRQLGGVVCEGSVLFFDLRNSVSFAETKPPAVVMAELNRLFALLIPLATARGGLILRYNGDGFTAVFGVPKPTQYHARDAVLAALEILGALDADLFEGVPRWRGGIGINTGRFVFGSLGTADRPEFTIIGDTVNTAARLQDACKDLKVAAIFSEATIAAAAIVGEGIVVSPTECTIRGRRPIRVYTYGDIRSIEVAADSSRFTDSGGVASSAM